MIILILLLQIRLWTGEGSVPKIYEIEKLIEDQREENKSLKQRNQEKYAQIQNLSNEHESDEIEGRARQNLGLIKKDETFFLIVEKEKR